MLIDSLIGTACVKSVSAFSDLILPGAEDTIPGISAMPGSHVTVIAMLACTNDAVTVSTALVPHRVSLPAMSSGGVYDAGT